jgi:hypothetical protein
MKGKNARRNTRMLFSSNLVFSRDVHFIAVLDCMNWHYIEKEFYDYADDIEGVNIHYVWTPLESEADWENQRVTRFMPRVQSSLTEASTALSANTADGSSSTPRLRKKILKLPLQIADPANNIHTTSYLLHHYFEVFQDGHRHYSPLYSEEINTSAGSDAPATPMGDQEHSVSPLPVAVINVKESK